MALRATYHRVLKCTPTDIVMGCNKLDCSLLYNQATLRSIASQTKLTQATKDQNTENRQRVPHTYKGKRCLIKIISSDKLQPKYEGPYEVVEENTRVGIVKIPKGKKLRWISIRRIKPFKEEENVVNQVLNTDLSLTTP